MHKADRVATMEEMILAGEWGGKHSARYDGEMAAGGQASPADVNFAARSLILQNAVEMTQQIFSQTIAGTLTSGNGTLNVPARNVGLIKRFIVEISGTYNNTDGAAAATATAYGLAKILKQCVFTDLNNTIRIQTDGLHLAVLQQEKNRAAEPGAGMNVASDQAGAMIAGEFVASGSDANFPVVVYPLPAHGASSAFRAVFEVPLAYSDEDLRGAVYANVVNATINLQLVLQDNPSPAGADNTSAVWGTAAGNVSNVTVAVYQVYLDQLPVDQNRKPILPVIDLSTIYELKNSTFTGMVAGTEFPVPYANFRDFLSTLVTWNSTGATAGLKNGSDVSYWALQAANQTYLWKVDPLLAAQRGRKVIGCDLPLGTYYFSHRKKPISTLQYGNMELILNAASATAGSAYLTVYWEDFSLQNVVTQAGSLQT